MRRLGDGEVELSWASPKKGHKPLHNENVALGIRTPLSTLY